MTALLAAGTTILCDRYYYSGMVYSAAKAAATSPVAAVHRLAWARAPEVGLPRPDVVVFLDVDDETARARGDWGAEVYERADMQRRVRDLFWALSMGRAGAGADANVADSAAEWSCGSGRRRRTWW